MESYRKTEWQRDLLSYLSFVIWSRVRQLVDYGPWVHWIADADVDADGDSLLSILKL